MEKAVSMDFSLEASTPSICLDVSQMTQHFNES